MVAPYIVVQFVSLPQYFALFCSINLWKELLKELLMKLKTNWNIYPILNLLDCSLSW